MTQTISGAIAQRQEQDNRPTPARLVQQYTTELTTVLPPQLGPQAEAWIATALGALRTGNLVRSPDGRKMFELEVAALNNPYAFMRAMREAAREGLTPGTAEYYLTPRKNNGRMEILGIIGYQGYIEQMFRAGYVTAVVTDVVRVNDEFTFRRGLDEIPIHPIDYKLRREQRGEIYLAYAYAKMSGGGYSDVIIVDLDDIEDAKKNSAGSDSKYSPWVNFPTMMWKKTAVRKLKKFVPTSSVDRRAMEVAAQVVQAQVAQQTMRVEQLHDNPPSPSGRPAIEAAGDDLGGEVADHAPDPDEMPAEPPSEDPTVVEQAPQAEEPPLRSATQQRQITTLLQAKGIASGPGSVAAVRRILGDETLDPARLTAPQADAVIAELQKLPSPEQAVTQAAQQ